MALANATDRKSANSPSSRILIGFAIGAVLLLLTWAARGLADEASNSGASDEAPHQEQTTAAAPGTPASGEAQPAADGWSTRGARPPSFVDGSMGPLEVGGALLAVIVLLVGAAFLLRRVLRGTRLAPGRRKVLDMVDALPLGPRRFVYVVQLEGRTLVLGAGGDRVSLLAEYGEDELPAEDADARIGATAAPAPAVAGRSAAPAAPEEAATPSGRLEKALAAYRESSRDEIDELPGAHRVPKAFRHLLERAMKERGEA